MENGLKIGDFAKLTGVTIKTILHYHKVGLLAEAARTASGYRLYGVVELNRMRSIKHLKSLGLSLEQIRIVLGEPEDDKSFEAVLLALREELLAQIGTLQSRVDRIQRLLDENRADPHEAPDEPPSFKMFMEIMGEEAIEQYINTCPEMYELERKMYGIMDEFDWGIDPDASFRMVAEFFRDNPEQYQESLNYGVRITAISDLDPNSPEIVELALNYSTFIKNLPIYSSLLDLEPVASPLGSMWSGIMADEFLSPAQVRFIELLGQFLAGEDPQG